MLLRWLCASAALIAAQQSWSTDFASNDGVFLVDDGAVSHCPACIYEDAKHVSFGAPGVQLRLDDVPCAATPSACCAGGQCARLAAGHLRSAAAQAFGTFSFVARPSFAASGGGGSSPGAFACLTTSYLGSPHHEVATCFVGSQPREVSLGYWSSGVPAAGIVHRVNTSFDLHAGFNNYTIEWTPTSLRLAVNGAPTASATAAAPNTTIPWLAGQALLINRAQDGQSFSGAPAALLELRHAAYSPLTESAPAAAPATAPAARLGDEKTATD